MTAGPEFSGVRAAITSQQKRTSAEPWSVRQAVRMASEALLSLVDLRQYLNLLLDELERKHGMTVDLDADYYWTVGPDEAFRFDGGGPPEPTVGQLTDDLQSLRNLLSHGADHPVVLWHDLAHTVGILGRLAALDQAEPSSDG